MSTASKKRARLIAVAFSAVVLALALFIPGAVGAQALDNLDGGGFELEIGRDCSNISLFGDPATQCSFNIAKPWAKQYAPQTAWVKNDIEAEQEIEQEQENTAISVPISANLNFQRDLTAVAEIEVESGDAKAYGHWQKADVYANQWADAGAYGFINQEAESGEADAEAEGDNYANGGFAGANQESTSVISGEGELEIEGEIGVVKGGDAVAIGKAGDGGEIEENEAEAGKGGSNLGISASLGGFAIGGDSESGFPPLVDSLLPPNGFDPFGSGGSATGGDADEAENELIAGDGGNAGFIAISGDGGDIEAEAKTANWGDTNVNALAKGVGDNAWSKAEGAAVGGSADGGKAGHFVIGGKSGDAYNEAAIVGGQAANVLNTYAKQWGDVVAYSGSATNNGSSTASVNAPVNQNSWAKTGEIEQENEAKGSNELEAEAESEQDGPIQVVFTGDQTSSGTATADVDDFEPVQ